MIKPFRDWPLQTRFFCLIGPVVAIGITIIAAYNLQALVTYRLKEAEQDVRYEMAIMVNRITHQLRSVEKSVDTLANVIQDFDGTRKDLQVYLSHLICTHPEITGGSILITKEWREANRLKPCSAKNEDHPPPYDCYFADYFYEARGALHYLDLNTLEPDYVQHVWYQLAETSESSHWFGLYHSTIQEKYMFSYSIPIYKEHEGERIKMAYAIGDMELDKAFDLVQSHLNKELVFARLINDKGLVLIDGKGKKMYPVLDLFTNRQPSATWETVLKKIYRGEKGMARLPCYNHNYSECLFAYYRIPSTEMSVVLSYSLDATLSSINRFIIHFILLSLLLVAVILYIIHRICRSITHPIVNLSAAAENMGKGEFRQSIIPLMRKDEVGTLVNAFIHMQSELQNYTQKLQTETAKSNRIEGEMHAASIIQQSMLKGKGTSHYAIDQLAIWAKLKSAHAVGGDFYHYAFRKPNKLLFVIGDVSDKGVSAALFMAKALSIFKYEVRAKKDLLSILHTMNAELYAQNDACMFVTLISGELDFVSGEMQFVSAGHDMPFIIRDENAIQVEGPRTQAMGLSPSIELPVNHCTLQVNDRLVCFTDGLTEAFSEEGEIFGLGRFSHALESNHSADVLEIGEFTFKTVQQFSGTLPKSDDTALLIIGLDPSYTFLIAPPAQKSYVYHHQYTAEIGSINTCLKDIEKYCKKNQLEEKQGDIQLTLEEILSNAIKYGHVPFDEKIHCHWCLSHESFYVEVVYQGLAFNPLTDCLSDAKIIEPSVGGLGLNFVKELTTEQAYLLDDEKNRLCILFSCG